MKKPLKIVLIIVGVLVGLVLLVSVLVSPIATAYVNNNGEKLVGRKLTVDRISANILTGHVAIKGLKLYEDDATTEFVTFDLLDVKARLLRLLVQKSGDYRESWQPYKISDEALKQAQMMADKVTKALTGAGIWGVEFFLTKQGEVIFSELSPRPHDTGMVTLGHTTNLSEFELHFRAVMGLPIAGIHLEHAGASAVILSPKEASTPVDRSLLDYNFVDALKEDRTRIRIFGKPEAHKGRRMGVVLCYGEIGDDVNALRDKAKRLAKTVLGTDPYTKFEH